MIGSKACVGFPTPSRKNEFYSQTMVDWNWPEYAIPTYIKSHIHQEKLDKSKGEYCLVPTFRLPTLIHSRSANSKWLYELSNNNPVWMSPQVAAQVGVETGDLVRITTETGYFVNKAWVTEGIRPGIVACSHHLGRWRREDGRGTDRWGAPPVQVESRGPGVWRIRRTGDIEPFESGDPDSKRVWWREGGVHQNLTHGVHPDPISGMHCWHQKVTVTKAAPDDRYGDVEVDTKKSFEVYKEWLARAASFDRPDRLRRPLHFARAVRPADSAYVMDD